MATSSGTCDRALRLRHRPRFAGRSISPAATGRLDRSFVRSFFFLTFVYIFKNILNTYVSEIKLLLIFKALRQYTKVVSLI